MSHSPTGPGEPTPSFRFLTLAALCVLSVAWLGTAHPAAAEPALEDAEAPVEMTPGDGLTLEPGPAPAPVGSGFRPGAGPVRAPSPAPLGPVPLVAAAAVLAAARAGASRAGRGSRGNRTPVETEPWQDVDVPAPPDDVLFVFIVGHGNELTAFDSMKERLGLDSGQWIDFDYRWIVQDPSHVTATQHATNDQIADTLQAFVAGLGVRQRPIYLVGFSKGGAGVAKLVARWDRSPEHAVPAVIGAALLDPPISGGLVGTLQSGGLLFDEVPDDGFYDPEHCDDAGCVDERHHLGTASGVEVFVVRNPDSSLTNFDDDPTGLRVYDLEWDGGRPDTDHLPHDPMGFIRRSSEAHSAVLDSAAVAACIAQEAHRARSCEWKGRFPELPTWVTMRRWWGRGSTGKGPHML